MAELCSLPFETMPSDISSHDNRGIASDSWIDIRNGIPNVKECNRPRYDGVDKYSLHDSSMDELFMIKQALTNLSSTRR